MAFKKTGNDGNGKKSYGKSYGAKTGGRSFEKKSYGGSRGGPRGSTGGGLELFDVTCAQCGTHTQVPFKPTGERPVLCRSCFNGGDGGSARDAPRSSPRGNAGGGSDAAVAAELRMINEKLDKIIEALDLE